MLTFSATWLAGLLAAPALAEQPAAAPKPPAAQPAVAPAPAAAAPADSAAPAAQTQPKKRAEPRGRLPAYFGKVVNKAQREQIYGIQKEYDPKIDALEAELAKLRQERDAKIDALLTPEQKAQIEQLKSEAAAKRKKPAVSTAAPSSAAPSPAPGGAAPPK